MKKFAALLLTAAMLMTCAVSAMAGAGQWVDIDLEGYNVVCLFNYNESIAIDTDGKTVTWGRDAAGNYFAIGEATQWISSDLAQKETAPQSGMKDPAYDARYVKAHFYVAGFEANEIIGNGAALNAVPVDLTVEENTAFVYPIVTTTHVVLGLLYAKVNVDEGYVMVEGQMKDQLYDKSGDTLTIYTAKSQLADGGEAFNFGDAISIEDELGGAPAVLVSITGLVTYPTLFGDLTDGGKWLAYQDYYRNENWVRTYRTNMSPALRLVAD